MMFLGLFCNFREIFCGFRMSTGFLFSPRLQQSEAPGRAAVLWDAGSPCAVCSSLLGEEQGMLRLEWGCGHEVWWEVVSDEAFFFPWRCR